MFEDRNKGKGGFTRTFLTSLLTSLGVGIILFFFASQYIVGDLEKQPQGSNANDKPIPQQLAIGQTQTPSVTNQSSASSGNTVQNVVKTAMPGVVGVSVLKVDSRSIFDGNTESWGVGSGVIVSPNGYILTNHHVAGGKSKRIIVSLEDGRNVDGTTVWADPILDLAVIKVSAAGLKAIPLGDANQLTVGEPAIAIGNPLGLQFQRTVTSGIISALNRTIKIETEAGANYMEDLIQTDASINPGNSGGPLLNSEGQVVGINTVKVTSAEGIGFAVPINIAIPIVNSFIERGDFVEPYLGIFAYDKDVVHYFDNTINIDSGVYVSNIDEDGPAYKSGLRVGCIMTDIDGKEINTMMQLRTYIYSKKPGDTVTITCREGDTIKNVSIVLSQKEKDGLVTR